MTLPLLVPGGVSGGAGNLFSRVVRILVLGEAQAKIAGAHIVLAVDGVTIGQIASSSGEATVTLPGAVQSLAVTVTYDGTSQLAQLHAGDVECRFTFPGAQGFSGYAVPEARCPDGTVGQPCVDCAVAGATYKICCR
jgi:hypothetical protein